MSPTSPKDPPSPGFARTSTQLSILDHLPSAPKPSFLSRRRGDSDSAQKSTSPSVSFGNGTPTSRPTSSPSSAGKIATVAIPYF